MRVSFLHQRHVKAPSIQTTKTLSFVEVISEHTQLGNCKSTFSEVTPYQRSTMPPAAAKPPSVEEWEAHKPTLQRLRHEGTILEDIMKHMKSEYGFVAS
jgi:hypothetical protein